MLQLKKNIANLKRIQTSLNRDLSKGINLDRNERVDLFEEKIQNKIEQNELSMRPLAASFYFKTREYSRAFDQHLTLGIKTHADFIRWIDFANNLRQEGRYELAITSYESLLSPSLEIKNSKIIGQALLGIGLTFEDKIIPSQKNNSLILYFPENEFFENYFFNTTFVTKYFKIYIFVILMI